MPKTVRPATREPPARYTNPRGDLKPRDERTLEEFMNCHLRPKLRSDTPPADATLYESLIAFLEREDMTKKRLLEEWIPQMASGDGRLLLHLSPLICSAVDEGIGEGYDNKTETILQDMLKAAEPFRRQLDDKAPQRSVNAQPKSASK